MEKLQQHLLHGCRRHAEMGIGNDNEGMAQHGRKLEAHRKPRQGRTGPHTACGHRPVYSSTTPWGKP
jgi:hypothetical protein